MYRYMLRILIGMVLILLSVGCQANTQAPPASETAPPSTAQITPQTAPPSGLPLATPLRTLAPEMPSIAPPKLQKTPLTPGGPMLATERAVADLAQRLGIDPAGIEVQSVVSSDFAAQDLGCPAVTQSPRPVQPAFVTGNIVFLKAGDTVYEYHTHGGKIAFCGEVGR